MLATAWSGKAVRLMLCAAIPEAMAIIASIVIHAIVNYSSRNAQNLVKIGGTVDEDRHYSFAVAL